MTPSATLTIGQLARRTGLSVSAIRFYEARGLVKATRGAGNQRRFARAEIRRLSFALIAQQLGLSIADIEAELSRLPQGQAPSAADWRAIATRLQGALAAKITLLQRTHELLDGCIGCGCLSLERCALYNPNDRAARAGPGPRFLLGDRATDFEDGAEIAITAPRSPGETPQNAR